MIRYALVCDSEHPFDGWFRSSDDFEAQSKQHLLHCPVCGSERVAKTLMAPAVARPEHASAGAPGMAESAATESQGGPPVALLSEKDRELRAMLRAIRSHVLANADNVGERFADTARKMHNEEIERRSIYGKATPEEAKALHEEGVEFSPIPVLPDELS